MSGGEDFMEFLQLRKKAAVTDAAEQAEWTAQKWVWIKDDAEGFVAANILGDKGDNYEVKLPNGQKKEVNKNDTHRMNPPKFDKSEDMAELAYLNEPAVLDNLRKRYYSNLIYTYSGLFCVVVNPYKRLPIYDTKVVDMYRGKRRQELPPHVYSIADSAYRDMLQDREDQSILVTGESGAGKTENTKKVIQYLAQIASGESQEQGKLELQLLQANPILEAFGNAKTIKNDNSSRFGKFIKIEFDRSGYITGGNIQTYLLEKSRCVGQGPNERNFHIFYQLLKSAPADLRKELLLDDISNVKYIANADCTNVESLDDKREFTDACEAMNIIGISPDEQNGIFMVLSGIMRMSQMEFKNDRSEQAQMADDTAANMVCKLLGLSLVDFTKAMLKPRIRVGREFVTKAQRADQVLSAIEAIAKATYERLFNWVVAKVNRALDTRKSASSFIGILDIAGFEIFKTNGFDQLCINFTNEKLQQFFNNHMFVVEQEEYKREGIEWTFIDFGLDLEPQIALIEKPMGVLSLLDEECALLPRTSDKTYVEKLVKNHEGKSESFHKLPGNIKRDYHGFLIDHYAGTVDYTCDGWLIRNADPLNDNITGLLAVSSHPLTKALFEDLAQDNSGRARRGAMRTVGQTYKDQLGSLMTTLRATTPHFVRCIIPNHEKKPGKMVVDLVLDQLRCNGVLEGIRICRKGFPNRVLFAEFRQRYEILCSRIVPQGFMDGRKACELMLDSLSKEIELKDQYQIGASKIFFRTGVLGQLEEMRDEKLSSILKNLQAWCLGYLARRAYSRLTNFEVAIKCIQKNMRRYLILRKWPWWTLFNSIKGLVPVIQEQELKKKVDQLQKEIDAEKALREQLKKEKDTLEDEKRDLKAEIEKMQGDLDVTSEQLERASMRTDELNREISDLENQLQDIEEEAATLKRSKRELEDKLDAMQDELQDAKESRDKLAAEKKTLDERVSTLASQLDAERDSNQRLMKEKSTLENQLSDTQASLAATEDKLKSTTKAKDKVSAALKETEEKLANSEKERNDLIAAKRKLESENSSLQDRVEQLEKRIKELEEELAKTQAELGRRTSELEEAQSQNASLQKQLRELNAQVTELQESLESEQGMNDKLKNKDMRALKDRVAELEDMMTDKSDHAQGLLKKKDMEIAALQSAKDEAERARESEVADLKKRLQARIGELESDLDALRQQKADAEKKLTATKTELDEANLKNEDKDKNLANTERTRKQLVSQVAELTSQLSAAQHELAILKDEVTKLTSDKDALSRSFDEKDLALTNSDRESKALKLKVDELQSLLDGETHDKLQLQNKLRSADADADELREQLREEEEKYDLLERNFKSLESSNKDVKAKWDLLNSEKEESEAAKSKLKREMQALHDHIADLESQRSKDKQTSSRLQGDVDDLNAQLEDLRSAATKATTSARKEQAAAKEAIARADAAEKERDAEKANVGRLSYEVNTLKNAQAELEAERDAAKKEAANVKMQLEQALNEKGDAGKLASDVRRLQSELDDCKANMEELEDELDTVEAAKGRLEVEKSSLVKKVDEVKASLEDMLETERVKLNKKLREVQNELDVAESSKVAAVTKANKLQAELNAVTTQLEDTERSSADAVNQARKFQAAAKDAQLAADEAANHLNELQNRHRDLESKTKKYGMEVTRLTTELERAERARKSAETGRDEALSEVDALKTQLHSATDSARRAQAELAQAKEELDQALDDNDEAQAAKARASGECEGMRTQLNVEKDRASQAEQRAQTLDRANGELREQLEALGHDAERKWKSKATAAEQRAAALQGECEDEKRRAEDATKKYKKSERKLKELQTSMDDAERELGEAREQVSRLTSKVKALSTQVEDAEAETTSMRSKMRRLQSELSEKEEQCNALETKVATLSRKTASSARAGGRASRIGRGSALADDDDE